MPEFPFIASLLTTAVLAAGASPAPVEEPWLDGAFAADPAAVARAAAKIEAPGAGEGGQRDVEMLFRDDRFTFDDEGRMTHRRRWVYRILTAAGLEDWSVSEARWSSWHQARPELRARVIDPGGGERWLESGAVSDLTAAQAGLAGDQRLVRASLPVEVGAVVEEEVVVRDLRPLFAAGVNIKHLLVMPVPVRHGRLTLVAPTSLPLRYGVRGIRLQPGREVAGGRVTLTFAYSDLPAARAVEPGLPPDVPRYPHVAFSTGESWSSVATAYGLAVDQQLDESEAQAVLRWLPNRGASAQSDRIAELLAGVRGNVRYSAAELGSVALAPSAPLATLKRGAGDGQDLAALLTMALRTEGIPAFVALVRSGYGMDLEPELPGLGRFDHALVYVPASDPVWIDPADPFSRAGELASDLQGRLALVASPDARSLIRTPLSGAGDNRTIMTIDVYMAEEGPARVVETSTHFGAAEHRQRLVTSQIEAAGRRLGYASYLEAAYRAEALGAVEETDADDLSEQFRLRLVALRAGRAWTTAGEGAMAIDLSSLIGSLPRALLVAGGAPRRGDFVFHEPFVSEWLYRIHPPPGMRARVLPEDLSWPLGTGHLSRTVRLEGSGVHAGFRLDTGRRRLTADQFHAFSAAVRDLLAEDTLVLWFRPGKFRLRRNSSAQPHRSHSRPMSSEGCRQPSDSSDDCSGPYQELQR